MYLRILKKDLKRKKTMNVILLLFIILATMFVASSVNNIISVTTALDDFFEMANAPDYFAMTVDKALQSDVDEILDSASSINNYNTEKILYLSPDNFIFEKENAKVFTGTHMLQSDKDLALNYYVNNDEILKTVKPGEIYISSGKLDDIGVKIGDKLTIKIENVSREFTIAGTIKDILDSEASAMCKYIISSTDFESFIQDETIKELYGGNFYYIYTDNIDKTMSEISEASENFVASGDKAFLKFIYVFDMVMTGILIVVSIILIAIAFVVLRFTISFTLSEEFREIGVMKAIGISNPRIRGLYLVKYAGISMIGAVIGLILSFPFGKLLIKVSSSTITISDRDPFFINILCAILVILVTLLFCYSCTRKVNKMTPIDAIRNGQTGERFRKKSLMSLKKTKLGTTPFLALNDIVSSPKRYGIVTLTFFLCLSLMLMLSATVSTMKSGTLIDTFGYARYDVSISNDESYVEYMVEGGRAKIEKDLAETEQTLAQNGMPANCFIDVICSLSVSHGEYKSNIYVNQGTGTTMDMYKYTAGTAPENCNEIAITKLSAQELRADIGDTITIKTIDGEKDYIITAFYQSMLSQGEGIRLHQDEEINYVQTSSISSIQVLFTDNPDEKEISQRIEKIKELYPESNTIRTCKEDVSDWISVTETLSTVKLMMAILTVILAALVTVLMERSFITKETGEIALMKAIGFNNRKIYAQHAMRFAIVGLIAVVIAELLAMPLTHLCIDPVFKMMGMELGVDYVINPLEMYLIFPLVIVVTTIVSAFFTSLYTRKIKSSDTANIE